MHPSKLFKPSGECNVHTTEPPLFLVCHEEQEIATQLPFMDFSQGCLGIKHTILNYREIVVDPILQPEGIE